MKFTIPTRYPFSETHLDDYNNFDYVFINNNVNDLKKEIINELSCLNEQ